MDELINERINLILEYIEQILSDNIIVNAKMELGKTMINEEYITLDIYVTERNFEKHFNLGITSKYENDFYKQLLNTLIDRYLKSDVIGISKYRNVRGLVGPNFQGINLSNKNGSYLKLCFSPVNKDELISEYNNKIDVYMKENNIQSGFESLRVR